MKTIHWLGGLAALTLAAAAGGATLAQTPPPGGPQRAGPPPAGDRGPPGRMFGRFRPTPEEMKQLRAQRFAKMDANHDGKVTFDEFRAYREARRLERQHEAFSRMTGGKDSFTLAELNARGEGRMHGRGGRGGGRFGPGGFGGDDHVR